MHPVLFHLPFGLSIYAYGAMLCLSVVLGRLVAVRVAERDGLDKGLIDKCAVVTLVFALVGARLLDVVANPSQYHRVLDMFAWWTGGVVAYGGFLGGLVGSAVFCRMHGVPLLAWADCAAPSVCLGLLLTRIGCFLAGCDFGQPWDGPLAISFPAGSPAFAEHARLGILAPGATTSLPVHPTQLYESAAGLVLLVLVTLVRARRVAVGQAFAAFFGGYAVLRFAIEVLRADPGRGAVGPVSTSQFIAAATLVSSVALAFALPRGGSAVPAGGRMLRATGRR